jgi:phosphoglycolate phosphatase-like HAD superfamily hydrolase
MIWVLDVDGCLVDSLSGSSLRPGAGELLRDLRVAGCTVLLWSAGGASHARRRAIALGFADLVDDYHDKDGRDPDGRYRTDRFLPNLSGVVFVDDRPEDLPLGADVIAVRPYLGADPHDRGLAAALQRAGAIA